MIKRTLVKDLGISKLTKVSKVMQLNDDTLISCIVLPNDSMDVNIGIINSLGYGYATKQSQIALVSRNASGVKSMNMMPNTTIVGIYGYLNSNKYDSVLFVSSNGMKRIHLEDVPILNRPSKGVSLVNQPKSNISTISSVHITKKNDLIQYVDESKQLKFIDSAEVPLGDRETRISKVTSSKITYANVFNFNRNYIEEDTQQPTPVQTEPVKEQNKEEKEEFPKSLFDIDNND